MMGLGGYDSWSCNVADEYMLYNNKALMLNIAFIPVGKESKNVEQTYSELIMQ